MEFISKRTTLELALIAVSILLAGLLVFAVVGLLIGSRAADISWGAVADWATAGVTLMGFIGAVAALRVQSAALGLETQQHDNDKAEKRERKEAQDAISAAAEKEKKWRCAKEVALVVSAHRGQRMLGHEPVVKPPLTIACTLSAPRGCVLSDVAVAMPQLPTGFRVLEGSKTQVDSLAADRHIRWSAQGDYWSAAFGPEEDAEAWLRNRTSATFRDPDGHVWKLEGTQALKELIEVAYFD